MLHPLISQGFGGVAPKVFLQLPTYTTFCNYLHFCFAKNSVDHIHLSVAIPPKISISNFMGYLKGKSTLMLYDRHPELQSKWDKAFWARGYYVETIGNITDEAVQKYIKEQAEESRREDSRSTAL